MIRIACGGKQDINRWLNTFPIKADNDERWYVRVYGIDEWSHVTESIIRTALLSPLSHFLHFPAAVFDSPLIKLGVFDFRRLWGYWFPASVVFNAINDRMSTLICDPTKYFSLHGWCLKPVAHTWAHWRWAVWGTTLTTSLPTNLKKVFRRLP